MKKIILYVKGKDRPGIISEISSEINNSKGNIETSKMIKLGSYFNILALIEINEINLEKLKSKLNNFSDLSITIDTTKKDENDKKQLFYFRLKGADNEGIVHAFTNYFYNKNINILDLDSEIINAPITGQPLFFLKARILLTKELESKIIKKELIELSNTNNVAIKFEKFNKPIDY